MLRAVYIFSDSSSSRPAQTCLTEISKLHHPASCGSQLPGDKRVDMDPGDVTEDGWPLLSWVSSCFIIFGGALPYIPQYQEIRRTSNPDGFSTLVCLVLLVANILRIFFWFGKFFEFPLLLQSILMIITMLTMLKLCCSMQTANRVSTKRHFFTDFEPAYFWKWSRFEDYLQFVFSLTISGALLTYVFLDVSTFVEGMGLVALLTEAMLGVPQLLQNFKNRSTRGMRRCFCQPCPSALMNSWPSGRSCPQLHTIIHCLLGRKIRTAHLYPRQYVSDQIIKGI
ncbi:solute carrier family 66 member 2-like isoform X2 [Spea bombifrons]|uniref:solute carrier family 66 member 2-like isoform X2 n=1 Tax=Spea bombifrons TaxID=233779 RepID=UPI00234A2A12|nr:solute carrier family 66 member 2-like isoform X2 [Spea bombifrons]